MLLCVNCNVLAQSENLIIIILKYLSFFTYCSKHTYYSLLLKGCVSYNKYFTDT